MGRCPGGFPRAGLRHDLPEPFPTSPSGSPWGEVGNGGGRPPQVVFAGRRPNGYPVWFHGGVTAGEGRARGV